jgi:hypothetical protein
MAVGLKMRLSILITSVFLFSFSFVQDRDKGHDDLLDVLIFHEDGKTQRVVLQLPDVFSGYGWHDGSSN